MVFTYALGTACIMIYNEPKHRLYIEDYWDSLLSFSASLPFYYVLVFLQLVLVSNILYMLVEKIKVEGFFVKTLSSFAVFIISLLFVWFTRTVDGIYGSGEHLLGGVLFFIWYLGMVFAATQKNKLTKKQHINIVVWCGLLFFVWEWFTVKNVTFIECMIDKIFTGFDRGYPLYYFIPAFILFVVTRSASALIGDFRNKIITVFEKFATYIGKHTIFIYIFHRWIRDWFYFENKWMDRILCFSFMLFVPLLIEEFCELQKRILQKTVLKI